MSISLFNPNGLRQLIEPIVMDAVRQVLDERQKEEKRLGKFLTVHQLQCESGLSKQTIYQYSRRIPGREKHGGKLVFRTEDVLRWIAEGCPRDGR